LSGHLRKLLPNKKPTKGIAESRVLVFALYKKEATRVEQTLQRQGYAVGALHGDMSQTARMDALDKFKTGVTNLLVATDVAARGLDIPNVAAVINYTFPLTIEDYIHRIGRTGESLPGAQLVILPLTRVLQAAEARAENPLRSLPATTTKDPSQENTPVSSAKVALITRVLKSSP
jgi:superfamily II DNA/RNA helicase